MKYKKLFLLSLLTTLGFILNIEYVYAQQVNVTNNTHLLSDKDSSFSNKSTNNEDTQNINKMPSNNSYSKDDNHETTNFDKFSLVPQVYSLSHPQRKVIEKTRNMNSQSDTIYTQE